MCASYANAVFSLPVNRGGVALPRDPLDKDEAALCLYGMAMNLFGRLLWEPVGEWSEAPRRRVLDLHNQIARLIQKGRRHQEYVFGACSGWSIVREVDRMNDATQWRACRGNAYSPWFSAMREVEVWVREHGDEAFDMEGSAVAYYAGPLD